MRNNLYKARNCNVRETVMRNFIILMKSGLVREVQFEFTSNIAKLKSLILINKTLLDHLCVERTPKMTALMRKHMLFVNMFMMLLNIGKHMDHKNDMHYENFSTTNELNKEIGIVGDKANTKKFCHNFFAS